MHTITLHKGREGALQRYSPWVFSGAIARQDEGLEEGDLVRVADHGGAVLGYGHYQAGSIRVRMLQFGAEDYAEDLIDRKLAAALALRTQLGLAGDSLTNAYRLIHAAGDGLPGLIVDRYGSVAVVQCHSIGMHRQRDRIAEALLTVEGIDSVYDKSSAVLPERYGRETKDGTLAGASIDRLIALENGRRFEVDIAEGQKTGFFLDQRDNRWLLGSYARDQRVLNTFAYTGGFSVYALLGGAARVDSVDLSARANELTTANVAHNGEFSDRHAVHTADVLEYLKTVPAGSYDIVVVDPPAYAKNKHRRHKAVQAYKRLNARAMAALRPGGLLFTFSCSRVVDRQLFQDTIVAAGLESGRTARVLHRLAQGADHPVSLFHPEGDYLKGLVVQVD
ncbi:23S rRNA (cytosine1962-C5)-methyltransferase [Lewinella marina]|uniref:RlmI/RlmK family 23S rRNA methyltransferase n=1 Tax=Neolewinella marina TaxID=438751 RepID=A0A2G0CIE9_9BACT|nr:class I SAM-dependent rRNA methyltransferase [Neolewinella marina]NJB85108.1 23S rRNA (cytosine1962-C5)-methyltransferase [Neolewinella marina]PHK99755.1 RlmI/RlmK family 23S rRNA methyltransferase [Neolewinella marina]